MYIHKEIDNEDRKEMLDFLLKRYEPTNLSKQDILHEIFPVIKAHYYELATYKKISSNILKETDHAIRKHLFPNSYKREKTCKKLFEEWTNGDKKALDKLIEKNLHLPSLTLSKLKYDSPFDQDLFEDGIESLILFIKEYDKTDVALFTANLNNYLKTVLISKTKEYNLNDEDKEIDIVSLKDNTPILYYKDSNDYEYNNIDKYIEKENIKLLKKHILKMPNLTFLEKTILMSKFGFIGGVESSYRDLTKSFDCTYQNIYESCKRGLVKIGNINDTDYIDCDYSLFDYFFADEYIVLNAMKDLSTDEIKLIKHVWGNDFNNLKDLESISFTKDQVISYYKTIIKLYNKINVFIDKMEKDAPKYERNKDEYDFSLLKKI